MPTKWEEKWPFHRAWGIVRAGLPLMVPQRRLTESTPEAGGGRWGPATARGDSWPKLRHEGEVLVPRQGANPASFPVASPLTRPRQPRDVLVTWGRGSHHQKETVKRSEMVE